MFFVFYTYRKEYRRSQSADAYEREREVQRFYRGSSKEHRQQYADHYQQYDRERNERYNITVIFKLIWSF